MGKKKVKSRPNRQIASPSNKQQFDNLGSPSVGDLKTNPSYAEEIVIPKNEVRSSSFNRNLPYEEHKNAHKIVYLSHEDVMSSGEAVSLKKRSGSSNSSSYHDLIDGGAYNHFRGSGFDGSGDRVIAGSRSISHRSLFNNDKSLVNASKTSLPGSKATTEWEDVLVGEQVRISRRNERSADNLKPTNYEDAKRNPFLRSRTVSSVGSKRDNSSNLLQPYSSSQNAVDPNDMADDVRTYHADSEYFQNRLSKLSIHSNNDEFVLIGGHPPLLKTHSGNNVNFEVSVPRSSSRVSSYSTDHVDGVGNRQISIPVFSQEDVGRSISEQNLNEVEHSHVSRSSSRFTMGTTSNTDDRLILAARYSQSPEAEGLTFSEHNLSGVPLPSRHSSMSHNATASDRGVGFVEIPTLYSHPDDKFDDNALGEPFRPTSEHTFTPTSTSRVRPTRTEPLDNENVFSSSSSSLENQPQKALLVTSALTPVIPKRSGAGRSLSHSEESLVMKTPQTVQKVPVAKQLRQQNSEGVKITVETAIQTGSSIRLRQNEKLFGDVLSECAHLPSTHGFAISSPMTTSYVPGEKCEFVNIPVKEDQLVAPNSFRARLRHISDIYSSPTESRAFGYNKPRLPSTGNSVFVEVPKTSHISVPIKHQKPAQKSTEEIVIPAANCQPLSSSGRPSVDRNISTEDVQWKEKLSSGDSVRNRIPRGRIRDLASAFDNMAGGSPVRPIEFKSQVNIPSARDDRLGHSKRLNRAENTRGIRADSISAPLGGPLNGSSSSAFKSSTQTIRSHEERRSTSSSLHYQPHVFTRNTFLSSSTVKPGGKSNLPVNVEMETNYSPHSNNIAKGDGGFVSAFEKIPLKSSSNHQYDANDRGSRYTSLPRSTKELSSKTLSNKTMNKCGEQISGLNGPTMFTEYSRVIDVPVRLDVPIEGKKQRLERANTTRAKTQEIPACSFEFESRYEERAVSGDLNESRVFGMQKPLFAASREAFGRDTAEDLHGKQRQHQWISEFQINQMTQLKQGNHQQEVIELESTVSPIVQPTHVTSAIYEMNHDLHGLDPTNVKTTELIPSSQSIPSHHHHRPYSPPATEDAGSRITHHTSQTLQSDNLLGTEDSSIRGKIDRMFDFVESDGSRKTMKAQLESHASTDTIGTNGVNSNCNKYRETFKDRRQNWSEEQRLGEGAGAFQKSSQDLRQRVEPTLNSPERLNTATVSEMEYFESDLEYSLSQYREMQREQLRRRLPSADEPQFFRSPTLTAPHAGQSMHAYRTKDFLGTPTAGEKFHFPLSSSVLRLPPAALATSTPFESPSGRQLSFSMKENYSQLELNSNSNIQLMPPNETFVSSISGVSAADKQADVMRKINRLSYMIENSQKQMSMNEAALADAVKRGRRSQEVAAHRSILISRETLRLQRIELRRLHAISAVRRPPPPMAKELRGDVVFKNLIVHLNKLFVSRLTIKDDGSYSFVALFKYGHQVEATEMVPLRVYHGEETSDKLFFVKQIQFSDIPVDFTIYIEIYAMRIGGTKPVELSLGSALANKCKSLIGPPQKKCNVAMETAFKFRGRLVLDREAAGERCLYLDDVTYPLEGTVTITTQCSRLPEAFEVDFRGFLTMFSTISDMACWERYWAVLRRGVVLFWKYPDDEKVGREPKMQIDLTKCTNNSIEKCGFDLCPRANSFSIEILVDSEDGTIGSVVEKKRVLLSADTSEMLSQWLFTINETLDVIRGPI